MTTRRGDGVDTCIACGSGALYDTEGTEEYPGEMVRVCEDCGHIHRPNEATA